MAGSRSHSKSIIDPLTEREQEILALLVEGLSNQEIVEQMHLAHSTVKWYNSQIYSKLGVTNRYEAIRQARALGLSGTAPEGQKASPRSNLPVQTTRFIGRQHELNDIANLLANPDIKLVTILAPGGMGKTRLSLAAAERQLRQFTDGVFFVPLAPLTSPGDIVTAIAESVGFSFYGSEQPKQQLLGYLRERRALLVLDNFEHMLEGVLLVTDILQSAPQIKVLATSREKLNLSGETVFTLSGLHFPDWETPEDALEFDAVKLFTQSAQLARPDFEIQAGDLTYLARICRLTEGMPLGIVLAAGWLDALTVEQIASEVQQGIDILETELRDVPERQRSIRATFNYSWDRLTQDERDTFMKLSVFRGGFTTEAAQAVADTNIRILRKLVDKALVQALPTGRYDIHELLRQYGEEKLYEADKAGTAQQTHCAWFAGFMQQREADVKGRRQLDALNEIEADFNNIRAAWIWAIDRRQDSALDVMLETLHLFCELRARYRDGHILLDQAVRALSPSGDEKLQITWYRLQSRQAGIWLLPIEHIKDAHDQLLRCQEATRSRGDQFESAYCTLQLGETAQHTGDLQTAIQFHQESCAIFRALPNDYYVVRTLRALAFDYFLMGHQFARQSLTYSHELVELARAIGDRNSMAHGLLYLGLRQIFDANYRDGLNLFNQAQTIWREIGDKKSHSITMAPFCWYSFRTGEFERAEALATQMLALGADVNYPGIRVYGQGMFSMIAAMREDYPASLNLAKGILGLVSLASPIEMVMAEVGLMNFQSARYFLNKTVRYALQFGDIPTLLMSLPLAAAILAHSGEQEHAVELLGLAYTEPRTLSGWMEKWLLITRLRSDLEAELGSEVYAAAWERGSKRDLDIVAKELLVELRETQQK